MSDKDIFTCINCQRVKIQMLRNNSISNEIQPDILRPWVSTVESNITCDEPLQLQDTNMSKPPHFDFGCEPKLSRCKKSNLESVDGSRAGSPHSLKLTLSCSPMSVIFSSSILEELYPPSYHTLQSSLDFDKGTSMTRHLAKVADSGAQGRNKFPRYKYNHNANFKFTYKLNAKNNIDGKSKLWNETLKEEKDIPIEVVTVVSSCCHFINIVDSYKRAWGIPPQCKLVGGGENTLNSNSTGAVTGSAANNTPSPGTGTINNSNNSGNWPAGLNPSSSNVVGNAWNAGANGNNSGGRQSVGPSTSSNASHPSSTSQSIVKNGNNSGNQNQTSGQSQSNTVATSWAQAAGKNLPPSSAASNSSSGTNISTSAITCDSNLGNNMSSPNGNGNENNVNGNNHNSKMQIEELKSMRDSLFATDGWGGQHVNQDSSWDVPSSPEPATVKDAAASATSSAPWKPNVNNGTDLWEANLRNGGQPPPQSTQKTPWSHTPTTNIGGTWGEDDDGEPSTVWNGPSASGPNPGGQQWGNAPSNPAPVWGNTKKDDWGNAGSGWNDPRELQRPGNGIDHRNNLVDSAHMRTAMDHRNIGGDSMIRNNPRAITCRINGSNSSDPMWGGPPPQQPPAPGPHHHVTPTGPPPCPPAQASKMVPPGPAAVSHWKEMGPVGGGNMSRSAIQCPPSSSLPQNRLNATGMNNTAGTVVTGMKPDQLWTHPNSRNGAWGENGSHDMSSGPWNEDKITPWNEPNLPSWNSAQKPKTTITLGGGWNEGEVEPSTWGHASKMGPKALTKDYVWGSKQFRILSDMNFKKDDIENALRASSMNLEDALEYLNATRAGTNVNNLDGWRKHEMDISPFDHTANQPFPSHRFNSQQQLPFAVPSGGSGGGNGANSLSISHLNPAVVQKILTHQPPPQPTSIQSFNQTSRSSQNQPSAHQLRMLVQQIQMAVSAGYLNHQILNQPLAPTTLILLNSLLQQIKNLQQLQQQATQQSMYPGGQPNKSGAYMTLTVKQQQCKQAIQALQNQIISTQSVYMKQQQQHQQSQHSLGATAQQQGVNMNDLFKPQDPVSMLQTNFNDLALKDPQLAANVGLQNQSKLNQWKLPNSIEKDDNGCNEFSRAPGTTTKSTVAPGSPNLNPLLVQTDCTWSNISTRCDGWPESVNELSDNKDWGSPASVATNFTDLVPEFEPGKPWKGSQMKSVEDDPNITPGSVARSPLLSMSTMKDTDIFNSPSNSSSNFDNESNGVYSPLNKVNNGNSGVSKAGWGDATQSGPVTDLWGVPKPRGPPPGLTTSKSSSLLVSGSGSTSNGWAGGSLGSPRWSSSLGNSQSSWMGSSWLLLRNLTPQIDGSTLKTLCMQHGPLNNFHLFLNHGIALAKYNSREEASKAQGALNSCVLGNTTIFAESPADNEVHTLLSQLNQQSTSSNNNWSRSGANNQTKPMQNSASAGSLQATSDTWSSTTSTSQLWPSALWGAPQANMETADPHRATPSSLNSFLPGDLLGGESI